MRQNGWFLIILTLNLSLGLFGMMLFFRDATPPDPNDPASNPDDYISIAQKNLNQLYWASQNQLTLKKITAERANEIVADYARTLAAGANQIKVDPSQYLELADLYRSALAFDRARQYYQASIDRYPNNPDRLVNARVRLSVCLAALDRVPEAIKVARDSFEAPPGNKPSILLAIYLEMVPRGKNKGYDAELATLLADAVDQHLMSVVDPTSFAGQQFLNARRHHIQKAFALALQLAPTEEQRAELESRRLVSLARI